MVLESIARGGHTRIVSLDKQMQLKWQYVHVLEEAESFPSTVVPQADGGAVVVGELHTPIQGNTPMDEIPEKWDERHGFWLAVSEGKVTGEQRFGGPNWDGFDAGAAHPAGGVVAAGSTMDDKDQSSGWVAHLNKEGAVEWEVKTGTPGSADVADILPFGDGFVVAGKDTGGAYVAYIDAKGQEQWRKTTADDFARDLVAVGDGMALLIEQFLEEKYLVVRLDSAGETLWETQLEAPGQGKYSGLGAIANGGLVAVGGAHKLEPHHDQFKTALITALAPDGTTAWQQEIPGGHWQFATDISLGEDGSWVLWGSREQADKERIDTWWAVAVPEGTSCPG